MAKKDAVADKIVSPGGTPATVPGEVKPRRWDTG